MNENHMLKSSNDSLKEQYEKAAQKLKDLTG